MESADDIQTQDGRMIIKTKKYAAGNPPKVVFLNGPVSATANQLGGRCTLANEYPALARGTASAGNTVGPSDASWTLANGHPGFLCIATGPVTNTMVVVRTPEAFMVKGETTANVANTADNFTIDNVTMQSGLNVVSGSSTNLTIQNIFQDKIDEDNIVTAVWNHSLDVWECQDITCPNTT
jgi:hypothetical protein